jgi:hypothetical protein
MAKQRDIVIDLYPFLPTSSSARNRKGTGLVAETGDGDYVDAVFTLVGEFSGGC